MLDALLVAALGMGGVFLFLVLLCLLMELLGRLAPPPTPTASSLAQQANPARGGQVADDAALVAVLQAAATAYEQDRRR